MTDDSRPRHDGGLPKFQSLPDRITQSVESPLQRVSALPQQLPDVLSQNI